jgi:dTDP-4-amino-4,6-dideoxygalactose transaminase
MSNVVAGVGRGQLEVLDLRVRQHREINAWYRELLKDVPV